MRILDVGELLELVADGELCVFSGENRGYD